MGTLLLLRKPLPHWLENLDALPATMPELVAASFLQRQILQ